MMMSLRDVATANLSSGVDSPRKSGESPVKAEERHSRRGSFGNRSSNEMFMTDSDHRPHDEATAIDGIGHMEASVALSDTESPDTRKKLRSEGHNVTTFTFSPRKQTPPENPLNPTGFTPRTNVGKPRSTQPLSRVVRYFPTEHTNTRLEKDLHKALITRPTETAPWNTVVSAKFAEAPLPTPGSLAAVGKRERISPVKRGSVASSSPKPRDPDTAKSPKSTRQHSVALVEPLGNERSGAFMTEVSESREGSPHDRSSRSVSIASVAKNTKLSFAVAAKLKRKASRRKTLQDLEEQLETVAADFDDFGDEMTDFVDKGHNDILDNSHGASSQDLTPNSKDARARKSKRHAGKVQSRSLFDVLLPEFSEHGELLVSSFPRGVTVESTLDRIVSAEKRLNPNIFAKITPAVEEFLKGPDCKQVLLAFFWFSVVSMRKNKIEAELLRSHKAFEDAFYEVSPRHGALHPTVEEAEMILENPSMLLATTVNIKQQQHDDSEEEGRASLPAASPLATSTQIAEAIIPYTVQVRIDQLQAAVEDLIVNRGELEDAVVFEQNAFHTMSSFFGRAFRSVNSDHELFPFERKEAVFSIFPVVASHTTHFALVQAFPNDFDANLFNKRFRRDLARQFTFWCSGVSLQHVATSRWPTPIEDEAIHIANVLISKDNVVNGQYAVMKEFHKRVNHSAVIFNEWLKQQESLETLSRPQNNGEQQNSSTAVVQQEVNNAPVIGMLPLIASPPQRQPQGRGAHRSSMHNARPVTSGDDGQSAAPSGRSTADEPVRKRVIAPTLQSSERNWFEHGSTKGQLTAERAQEYGFLGAIVENTPARQRIMKLKLAGAVFSTVPMPSADPPGKNNASGGGGESTERITEVPVTSPFMKHYATTVLTLDLKVVDLAGREQPPLHFTQLSSLDKFSVHLNFSKLASPKVLQGDKATEEIQRAEKKRKQMIHNQQVESAHLQQIEEARLQYAGRLIDFHLSARNPDVQRDATKAERMLREALKAPLALVGQTTALCQQALRVYQEVMFNAGPRRHVLHDLSIRVACKIRQMQRYRGDNWGGDGSMARKRTVMTVGSRSSFTVIDNLDVVHTDFAAAVSQAEFPLVGERLSMVTSRIITHEWSEITINIRVEEIREFTELMTEFMRLHEMIFQRDRVRFPHLRVARRPSFAPLFAKEERRSPPLVRADAMGPLLSAEEREIADSVVRSQVATNVMDSLARGRTMALGDAAQKFKGKLAYDPTYSDASHFMTQQKKQEEAQHIEQLRRNLKQEYDDEHQKLGAELDVFVAATAIGSRGRLVTPPTSAEGSGGMGPTFKEQAAGGWEQSFKTQEEIQRAKQEAALIAKGLLTPPRPPEAVADTESPPHEQPEAILRQLTVRTPATNSRPQHPRGRQHYSSTQSASPASPAGEQRAPTISPRHPPSPPPSLPPINPSAMASSPRQQQSVGPTALSPLSESSPVSRSFSNAFETPVPAGPASLLPKHKALLSVPALGGRVQPPLVVPSGEAIVTVPESIHRGSVAGFEVNSGRRKSGSSI